MTQLVQELTSMPTVCRPLMLQISREKMRTH